MTAKKKKKDNLHLKKLRSSERKMTTGYQGCQIEIYKYKIIPITANFESWFNLPQDLIKFFIDYLTAKIRFIKVFSYFIKINKLITIFIILKCNATH